MRDHLQIRINGGLHRIGGATAFATLSDHLRQRMRLVGTKIVCAEGDCGACTVLVGRPRREQHGQVVIDYAPIDACIAFLHQLDGCHVVTVEGLNGSPTGPPAEEGLSAVQRAMVDCHGSQCGYCTPGFVMAMHGMIEEQASQADPPALTESAMRVGLSGNLCRCTGYAQIIDAGLAVDPEKLRRLDDVYPPARIAETLIDATSEPIKIDAAGRRLLIPRTVEQAVAMRSRHPAARLVAGATDVGVWCNHGRPDAEVVISIGAVGPLAMISQDGNTEEIVIGAGVTWTKLIDLIDQALPKLKPLRDVLLRFGSPQIRNLGTIGGNLINASPIADSIPALIALDAVLEIAGPGGRRHVPIDGFYEGYKTMDLRDDEILVSIRLRPPLPNQYLHLSKVSKRRDMDISTFTAAALLGVETGTVESARIAMGGVGPVVIRTRAAENTLIGSRFEPESMRRAGVVAAGEIQPIRDVRGSAEFRRQLAENVLVKFYYQHPSTEHDEVTA